MPARAPSSELIRVVVIIAFFLLSIIMNARKKARATKPAPGQSGGTPLDSIREAMRQASEQARARRGQPPTGAEPLPLPQSFSQTQPPTIQPESSMIPTLLLLSLLVCIALMAYRFFAR